MKTATLRLALCCGTLFAMQSPLFAQTLTSTFNLCIGTTDQSQAIACANQVGGKTTVTLTIVNNVVGQAFAFNWQYTNPPPNPPSTAFQSTVKGKAAGGAPGKRAQTWQWIGNVNQNGGVITFTPTPPKPGCGGTFTANLWRGPGGLAALNCPSAQLASNLYDGDASTGTLLVSCCSTVCQNPDGTWTTIKTVTNSTSGSITVCWDGLSGTISPGGSLSSSPVILTGEFYSETGPCATITYSDLTQDIIVATEFAQAT